MKLSFNGQLNAIEQSIYALQDDLRAKPPVNGSVKQVELALYGALDNVQLARQAYGWPEPTTEAPDVETMEEWLFGDGYCEATDSCIVEPDGVCPHGHPSWLRKLGLT